MILARLLPAAILALASCAEDRAAPIAPPPGLSPAAPPRAALAVADAAVPLPITVPASPGDGGSAGHAGRGAARDDGGAPPAADEDALVARHVTEAPRLDGSLDDDAWRSAAPVAIVTDWRGAPSSGPETVARLAWSDQALFFSFDCAYDEPLSIDEAAPTNVEHRSLYRFEAVEVFLDPDPSTPGTYLELEVGPRGHFLDVDVDRDRRPRGDVAWSSGTRIGTSIDPTARRYRVEARVPAAALGRLLLDEMELAIGLYRLTGQGAERRHLARFPTGTPRPSFHVPERFGRLSLRAQ